MSPRIKQIEDQPHVFVTAFIEPLREAYGPKRAIEELKRFRIDWQRWIADQPVDGERMIVDSFDRKGEISIEIARAFRLVDLYCALYDEELSFGSKSDNAPQDYRINWLGTQKQFRMLLKKLVETKLVEEDTVRNYGAIFERNFLHKGKIVPAHNIVSAARETNVIKVDDEKTVTDVVEEISKIVRK